MGGENAAITDRPESADLGALAAAATGRVVTPDDDEYRHARRVWNGMINRYPAGVVECEHVGDVQAAVAFAREHDLPVAVRGGGHNVAGGATVDDGLVLDLAPMDAVRIDPEERRVRVEGGATWGDVDRITQRFGLAVPGGVVSDTGIAGLTLGGGLGHLRRQYGPSCDNLVSADVVTADGDLVVASEARNEDLLWALRGGGGNFGVVTSFEFDCHPVGPDVAVLFAWYDGDRAAEVLHEFRAWADQAPTEASVVPFYAWVPEIDEFPEDRWGDPAIALLGAWAGDPDDGRDALEPLRELDEPIADLSGTMPYVDLQSLLDADYPHGRNYYWKSVYLDDLGDDAIDATEAAVADCPSPLSTIDLWHLGGAMTDEPPGGAAFPHRDAPYLLNFEANWDDPRETAANVEWVRRHYDAVRDLDAARGMYVNFQGFGEEGAPTAYGDSYDRLVDVKTRFDPDGVFRGGQPIEPRT